ncbi:MAG: SpoIIE family protein phosphatase [Candidatus Hydrogenedentes bacterium]|nr:SpoIIE family protein phosphatase [Candidatus Hydrogenedentota bacterium]
MDECVRILSIEDELTVRRSIVGYLEDSGFELLEADNGRVGLEIFHAEHPDLVLCDLRMPEVGGLQVLADIVEKAPETPIIVVSGTGTMKDAIEALKLGAWDYVMKPIRDMQVLEHAVEKALERARLIRENRESRELLEATNKRLAESLGQLEEDELAARHIQFQLLPKQMVTLGPFQFTWHIKTSAFLSGDFVDYFQIDDRHLGFYIADVSGHGVSSAFVTVLLKTTMNRLLEQYQRSEDDRILHPERVLQLLNEEIVAQEFDKYLTIFYAVLDLEAHAFVCSNGGHFPAPVLCDGQTTRFLDAKSLPVGLFDTASYEAATVLCSDSFMMAMFSDGVLEMDPTKDLKAKKEALLAQVERLSKDPLSTPLNVQMERLVADLGLDDSDTPVDDITVLLVRKGASS